MEPTASAPEAAAGEVTVQRRGPSFPAAATTMRPAEAARFAARDIASVPSEHGMAPSERLMTLMP